MQTIRISDSDGDAWEQHYSDKATDSSCGFKIHINLSEHQFISGKTLLVEEYSKRKVDFKVCNTQSFCNRLNNGHYGVTQIGKAATVYVSSPKKLNSEAQFLKALLTEFSGPCPPTDLRVPNSPVLSYRWAAKNERQVRKINSGVPLPVFDPIGGKTAIGNPFLELKKFGVDLIITQCLRQSSKGAVYEGIAAGERVSSPVTFRPVILKEFRRYAAKSHLGHDAWDMGESEIRSYNLLKHLSITPQLLWEGESNESKYILLEKLTNFIPLQEYIKRFNKDDLEIIYTRIECLIQTIINSGAQWVDVSPSNILINDELEVKAIDFEIASNERGTTYYAHHSIHPNKPTPRELLNLLREKVSSLIPN